MPLVRMFISVLMLYKRISKGKEYNTKDEMPLCSWKIGEWDTLISAAEH